jgi:hypothetical protein
MAFNFRFRFFLLTSVLVVNSVVAEHAIPRLTQLRPRITEREQGQSVPSQHSAVVRISVTARNANCSATFLSKQSFITAAHCLSLNELEPGPHEVTFRDGNRTVKAICEMSPGFGGEKRNADRSAIEDLAACKSESEYDVPYACLGEEQPAAGSETTLVGFGAHNVFPDLTIQFAGRRREGQTRIATYTSSGNIQTTPTGASAGRGDSGGPLGRFVNGRFIVDGVISRGTPAGRDQLNPQSRMSATNLSKESARSFLTDFETRYNVSFCGLRESAT